MASINQLDERRYKITVSNGYRPNGKKISKAKTIQVPPTVPKRGIGQYVAHAAEELERSFKTGYAEDACVTINFPVLFHSKSSSSYSILRCCRTALSKLT